MTDTNNTEDGRPGGLSSFGSSPSVSPLRASIPDAHDIMMTDDGLMSFSNYVGGGVAKAMRERGLWRDGDTFDVVLDRLRDMASIANACIAKMHDWMAQVDAQHESPVGTADAPKGGSHD